MFRRLIRLGFAAAVAALGGSSAMASQRNAVETIAELANRLGLELASEDQEFLAAVTNPASRDCARADEVLTRWQLVHRDAMKTLHRIFAIEDPALRQQTMQAEFEKTDPSWPFEYTLPMRSWLWVGGDEATARIAAGVSSDTDSGQPLERAWNLVRARRYDDAKLAAKSGGSLVNTPALQAAIDGLENAPDDLDAWLTWLDAIQACASLDLTVARLDSCWTRLASAIDREAKGKILSRMAAIGGTDVSSPNEVSMKRDLLEVAAIFSAAMQDPSARALSIARLGDREREAQRDTRAAVLYAFAAALGRDTSVWGSCSFNSGMLLRRLGRNDAAIACLEPIFDSSVDDREPNTLMQPYRNYRHYAAIEMSHAHEAVGRYQDAYEWMLAAKSKYTFQTYCGNCSSSERQKTEAELDRLAELAGVERPSKKKSK